jgi:hypothetical protein
LRDRAQNRRAGAPRRRRCVKARIVDRRVHDAQRTRWCG